MARIKLIFMMLMLISMHATSYAQKSPPSLDGKWFGRLKIGATNLRIGMQISREGEGYRVDFYSLDMPLYLGLMDLGLGEEEAFALSWGGGWDWDEDFNPRSWNWDEDFIEKANPNDSPGP